MTGSAIDPRYTAVMVRARHDAGIAAEVEVLLAAVAAGDPTAADALFAPDRDREALPEPLRFQLELAELRWVLSHPAGFPDDTARELYSALLERCAEQPARQPEIRALGAALHALERDGALPQAMVVRTRRRRD